MPALGACAAALLLPLLCLGHAPPPVITAGKLSLTLTADQNVRALGLSGAAGADGFSFTAAGGPGAQLGDATIHARPAAGAGAWNSWASSGATPVPAGACAALVPRRPVVRGARQKAALLGPPRVGARAAGFPPPRLQGRQPGGSAARDWRRGDRHAVRVGGGLVRGRLGVHVLRPGRHGRARVRHRHPAERQARGADDHDGRRRRAVQGGQAWVPHEPGSVGRVRGQRAGCRASARPRHWPSCRPRHGEEGGERRGRRGRQLALPHKGVCRRVGQRQQALAPRHLAGARGGRSTGLRPAVLGGQRRPVQRRGADAVQHCRRPGRARLHPGYGQPPDTPCVPIAHVPLPCIHSTQGARSCGWLPSAASMGSHMDTRFCCTYSSPRGGKSWRPQPKHRACDWLP